LGWYSRLDSN